MILANEDYGPCAFAEHPATPMPYSAQSTPQAAMPMAPAGDCAVELWHAGRRFACSPDRRRCRVPAQRAGAAVEAFANARLFIGRPSCGSAGLDGSNGDDRALADDLKLFRPIYPIDFTLAFARLADAAQV